MKRLVDFAPKWIEPSNWTDHESFNPFYVGVSFNCPCERCLPKTCPTCGHTTEGKRLAVMFWPPVDPKNAQSKGLFNEQYTQGKHQHVSGDTFETLTLMPSVGFDSIGHWHGNITNGVLSP